MNALPLLDGLEATGKVEICTAPPAGIAAGLLDGSLSVGLVPVATLLKDPELVPVGQCGIASLGAVDSVLMLLSCAPQRVRTLSLDPESRTSQLLARWVLRQRHGAVPTTHERAPGVQPFEAGEDAALVIGDRALQLLHRGVPCLDLGAEWFAGTGLPFVYALWCAKRGSQAAAELGPLLDSAAERGVRRTAHHAAEAARRLKLPEELCTVYLSHRIRYRLAEPERQGLAHFLAVARELA